MEKKSNWRRLPSPALIVAMVALFVAFTQTGLAARTVDLVQAGCNCANSSDIVNNSLTSVDIKNGSLLKKDFKKGQIPAVRGARALPVRTVLPARLELRGREPVDHRASLARPVRPVRPVHLRRSSSPP